MKIINTAIAALVLATTSAVAAPITQFNKTTPDGVYDLSQAQALALGDVNAEYIGFYRVREGNGTKLEQGDTFDATTMFNSVTSGASNILGFLNGRSNGLTYTGAKLDMLGTTTIGSGNSYFEGVAFLFKGTSNIVFRGTGTYNANQSRGLFEDDSLLQAEVPVPAALPLLLAGIGGLGLMRRRRKAA